jgi:hypothetical protein
MDIDKLIEDYRNADADRRLGLFFAHRELREAFEEIDQRPAGKPGPGGGGIAWERLQLLEAGGAERHPDQAIRLPRGRVGRDLALLAAAALFAAGGLRLWLAASGSKRAPSAALERRDGPRPAPTGLLDDSP